MRVLSGLLKNCLVGFEDGFIAAVDGELDLDGAVIEKFGRSWPVLSCRVQEFEQSPRLQAVAGVKFIAADERGGRRIPKLAALARRKPRLRTAPRCGSTC